MGASGSDPTAVQVSVVVPAMNEAVNLPALLPRIDAALGRTRYEVLVVDDGSTDDTPEVCARLAVRYPVRLQVRAEAVGGLSGAVLHGFELARGEFLVVMDADLQHPPESIPLLLDALGEAGDENAAEVAIGSRYVPGGSTASGWGVLRWINSQAATLLARPFAGRARDPLSGFFALRRHTLLRARRLTPTGYKICLELLCKCRVRRVTEIPIHFGRREGGDSKLTLAQQFRYLEHLSRLYDFCFPRGSPLAKFLVTAALAWFVGLSLFLALLWFSVIPMTAAALSYPAAIAVSAVFHARYVRTARTLLPPARWPWLDFGVLSGAEWAACALASLWVAGRVREIHVLEVFAMTYAVATVTRYVLRKEFLQDIRGLRRAPETGETAESSRRPPGRLAA